MAVIQTASRLRKEGVSVSMQELSTDRTDRRFIVLGAGPAGLTAAYELTKYGFRPIVLEKADKVGGISRTESFHGYHFDMGGHRFFTKSEEVNAMWREMLGEDFLLRPRRSRIYYGGKFFDYPLKLWNVLSGLGFWESFRVGLSYARWHIFPYRREDTFRQWVTNRFGRRLFLMYFKSYTEKVWGISTSELSAEWAAQRIKGLSLPTAVLGMFVKPKAKIKTLIEEFHYPKYGPGMLWNRVGSEIERRNGRVRLNSNVSKINREGKRIVSLVVSHDGRDETVEGTDFISTIPISEFIKKLDPPPPAGVLDAASALRYRDFLTVCLIVDRPHLFDDNWLYIHDPHVKVGRIQNFKNWSPDMVPDNTKTSLGLEYFCNAGDALWSASDADLVELGKRELEQMGLARRSQCVDGRVFRVEKAYPVYDAHYNRHLEVIREYLDGLENARTIGRNGLHRYNNMDHSMLAGMFAVRNMVLGQNYDLWNVNAEREYHEEMQITSS